MKWIFGWALLFMLCLTRGTATAQKVRGTVSDLVTDQPISSALILLIGRDGGIHSAVASDAGGRFLLPADGQDSIRVRVQREGYRTVESILLAVDRARPLQLEVHLRPHPVQLEGVTATAPKNRNLAAFLKRQQSGFGIYLGPDEIAKIDPKSSAALLFRMSGSTFRWSRSGRAITAESCPDKAPRVYLDGWELDVAGNPGFIATSEAGIRIDSFVPASALRAVEVYRNPAQAPPEYQKAFVGACPVVVIWTDFGFGDFN